MILDTKRFLPLICFLCLTSWAKLIVPKNFRRNYTIDPSSLPNKHYWSLKFKISAIGPSSLKNEHNWSFY